MSEGFFSRKIAVGSTQETYKASIERREREGAMVDAATNCICFKNRNKFYKIREER